MLILSQLCLNFCSNIWRWINVLQKKKGKGKRDGKNGAYKFFEQPCIDEKKKLFP